MIWSVVFRLAKPASADIQPPFRGVGSCLAEISSNVQTIKSKQESRPADGLPTTLDLLRCPVSGSALQMKFGQLVNNDGTRRYDINDSGIPLFAAQFCTADARVQMQHYDRVAKTYVENLGYPHTQEYLAYLDRALLEAVDPRHLGTVAEICCGRGEAFHLVGDKVARGIGVDVSVAMLEQALSDHDGDHLSFIQGDATMLPLASEAFDSVFMLGGIHHVNDRQRLFAEVARILKPGGAFYFREPVSDLFLWRWIRAVIYRLSPALDHETERPLLYRETVPVLEDAGLQCGHWQTHGFLGFCFFMNSDVLVFNRLFRFIPGIRSVTRAAIALDQLILALPLLHRAGLQVIGVARKPKGSAC